MTREEAIAACLAAGGWDRGACVEYVDASMVDGQFCDGSVVMLGGGRRRCVPLSELERVRAARRAAPLVSSAPSSASSPRAWVVVAGVAAVAAVLLLRR